jgi:hypothetical protein
MYAISLLLSERSLAASAREKDVHTCLRGGRLFVAALAFGARLIGDVGHQHMGVGCLGDASDRLGQALALDLGETLIKAEEAVHRQLRLPRIVRLQLGIASDHITSHHIRSEQTRPERSGAEQSGAEQRKERSFIRHLHDRKSISSEYTLR